MTRMYAANAQPLTGSKIGLLKRKTGVNGDQKGFCDIYRVDTFLQLLFRAEEISRRMNMKKGGAMKGTSHQSSLSPC